MFLGKTVGNLRNISPTCYCNRFHRKIAVSKQTKKNILNHFYKLCMSTLKLLHTKANYFKKVADTRLRISGTQRERSL